MSFVSIFEWDYISSAADSVGWLRIGLSPEEAMSSITWPLHPSTTLQLSNQPILICYNRGPSGPYYSNPCDVIPKHCFLSSERSTILHLTTDGGISSLFLLHFLLLFFFSSSHPHKDKEWGHTVISLSDHFINNKPAVNRAAHTSTNNTQSVCKAARHRELEFNCLCVCTSLHPSKLFLIVNQSRKCGAHCLCILSLMLRSDASCLWVAPHGVSCLTTHFRGFFSLADLRCLCSYRYVLLCRQVLQ